MPTPPLRGIHHLKLAVSDLARSLAFYEEVFGARRIVEADHRGDDGALYAHILDVPGLGTRLELRLNVDHAARNRRFDGITIAVDDRPALAAWDEHLTGVGAPHSAVLTALEAWLIVIEDPDQNRLRLYTLERHGPELPADGDSPWLQG